VRSMTSCAKPRRGPAGEASPRRARTHSCARGDRSVLGIAGIFGLSVQCASTTRKYTILCETP
jgi:hypothetical protein